MAGMQQKAVALLQVAGNGSHTDYLNVIGR